jgi:hypothetical protein
MSTFLLLLNWLSIKKMIGALCYLEQVCVFPKLKTDQAADIILAVMLMGDTYGSVVLLL